MGHGMAGEKEAREAGVARAGDGALPACIQSFRRRAFHHRHCLGWGEPRARVHLVCPMLVGWREGRRDAAQSRDRVRRRSRQIPAAPVGANNRRGRS